MFDIGFWEIVIIGVVALIVVGPERFPGMVKSVGFWVGRARQVVGAVKNELQTEINKAEQLQKLLDEQEEIVKRHKLLEEDDRPTVSVKGREPKPQIEANAGAASESAPPQPSGSPPDVNAPEASKSSVSTSPAGHKAE